MFKLIELHSAADKPDEPYVTWQLVKVSGFLFFSFHYAHQRQWKQQCGEGRVFSMNFGRWFLPSKKVWPNKLLLYHILWKKQSGPAAGTRGFPSNSSLTSLALPHWASLAPWKEVSTGFQKLKKGTAVNNRIFTDSSTIKWPISLAFYKQKEALLTKQEHSFNKKDPQSIFWKPWKALFWNK